MNDPLIRVVTVDRGYFLAYAECEQMSVGSNHLAKTRYPTIVRVAY